MKNKLIKKVDILLFFSLILAACLLFFLKGGSQSHLRAYVYEGSTLVKEVNLAALEEPVEFHCAGSHVTVLLQKDGAKILSSDCPTQTCVGTGLLTKSGDTAVCVPNRVTVTLRSGGEKQYQTY